MLIQLIAYAGGKKNKSYTIPDGVKVIAPAAFLGCTNLKEITFCKNLTHISNEAFRDCTKLVKIQLQEGIHERRIILLNDTPLSIKSNFIKCM